MPLNDTCLDAGGTAMRNLITHLSLHPSVPNITTGLPESSAPRQAAGWGAVSAGGDFSTTNKSFTGGGNGLACQYVGFWGAVTGGTFYGYQALTGDQTFNTAGEYTITNLTVSGTSP